MGLEGQKINDIKEVYSHPMAFLQCKSFFNNYPHIRLVESEDTAEEAQRISKNNIKGIGAIASKEAAECISCQFSRPLSRQLKII